MASNKRFSRIAITTISVCSIIVGLYLLFMLFSPKLFSMLQKSYNQSLEGNENQLQIQSVGINTKILEGGEEQLENGAWHRFPERGNPEIGGNFILSGHSFVWAYTPWQVSEKSYFYNLKDVKVGDEVTVRWNSKDYNYKVDSVFSIDPSQTNIEDKSDTPIMTIYTCTEGGSADGRVVVVAKPVTQQ
ncbi:MAG: hypothetical protein QG675_627 [Patescibacteria group bacterium]|nr:hypothetical protein [Patescibacteria group bacterium]